MIVKIPLLNEKPKKHKYDYIQRRKALFLNRDLDMFTECELLEFILFYSNLAISYGGVKNMARTLIKRYGSFEKVVEADYSSLIMASADNDTAFLIHMFYRLFKEYTKKKSTTELLGIYNCNALKRYCSSLFLDSVTEELYCLYFTDDLKLIESKKIDCNIEKYEFPFRKIAKDVLNFDCPKLVVTWNLLTESCRPSHEDVDKAKSIKDFFAKFDVDLLDCVIVGRDGILSMSDSRYI